MAHFCLLVITRAPEDVEGALTPFWDDDDEERRQPHFVFVPDSPQGPGFWKNPVGKWDGWIVGGRWEGLLAPAPDQCRVKDLPPEVFGDGGPLRDVFATLAHGTWSDIDAMPVARRGQWLDHVRRVLRDAGPEEWVTVVDCHC